MQIIQQLIPLGHPNRCGDKITPEAVVIHYTANDAPTATDTANVKYAGRSYKTINGTDYEYDGNNKFRYGSAQWYIDQDSATLAIPTNETAWGCGDRQLPYDNGYKGQTKIARDVFGYAQNHKTINYEICNNGDWNAACANAIETIAKDMVQYNISNDMIFRHYDITGKICPKPFVDNPSAWEAFKAKLVAKIAQLKGINPSPIPTPQPIPVPVNKTVLDLQKALNRLGFRGTNGARLTEDGIQGSNTIFATNAFQRTMGLSADGIAGPTTWTVINQIFSKPLVQLGYSGVVVRFIQRAVGATADGDFGPGTLAAIKKWQSSKGLVPDGIFGNASWTKLIG